ncbi:MAG: response regulator transcription factor [Burkholderiales bacterium]|nr:response regulator transcription factor [Burkholderiales bacterium]
MGTPTPPEGDVVLIVDDVPDNLAVLADVLGAAGHVVLIATDGERAIETAQRTLPDVILLDAVMPGLDGFETCRRLKAGEDTREIPVVFMTGLTETEHVLAGFAAGGIDYVTKPIQPAEVVARIGAHVQSARRVSRARDAIEASGSAIVVVDGSGAVTLCTRQAVRWLAAFFETGPDETVLPAEVWRWMQGAMGGEAPKVFSRDRAERQLTLTYGGPVTGGGFLLKLEEGRRVAEPVPLTDTYNLTPRELEVLLWVAKGKTNRDIGDILGLSPRTVNKHLEHIYEKLGVETRTAAAAMAMRGVRPEPERVDSEAPES